MKKIFYALAAALLLPCLSANAEDKDVQTGSSSEGSAVSYSWRYWNDYTPGTGNYAPNWRIEYTDAFEANPASAAINYVLKKGDAVVQSGAANVTNNLAAYSTFWYNAGVLEEGDYTMESILTIIPAGTTEPLTSNFSSTFHVDKLKEPDYVFEFKQTSTPTSNSISIDYEFVLTKGTIPEGAEVVYTTSLGIQPGGYDVASSEGKGTLVFPGEGKEALNAESTYTIYSNNPHVDITIDGTKTTYYTNCPNWSVTTLKDATAPAAELTYTIVPGTEDAYFDYEIKLENISDEDFVSARVWLDAPGDITKGEAKTLKGRIPVDVSNGKVDLWFKGQVTYKDGDEEKTISTNPNNVGVSFEKLAPVEPAELNLSIDHAQVWENDADAATSSHIYYVLSAKNLPENATDVTYKVWGVYDGKTVGEENNAKLYVDGEEAPNFKVTGLPEDTAVIEVKVYASATYTVDGQTVTVEAEPVVANCNTTTTSVEELELEEGEAQYFNLQGLPVANPEKGIFIKVTGKKAEKVRL